MHDNALTAEAARIFPLLQKFEGFYLVGGTALALQIGHRISVDFDLFSFEELSEGLLQKIKRVFPDEKREVTLRTPEQINVLINGIKITFLYYPYKTVLPLVKYHEISLASVQEIAAMKAFAIGKRLSYKDYVDWYFLLHEKLVTLQEIIVIANKKYGGDFNDRLFLEQLASFSDVQTVEIDFLRDPVDRKSIEDFLVQTIRDFKF